MLELRVLSPVAKVFPTSAPEACETDTDTSPIFPDVSDILQDETVSEVIEAEFSIQQLITLRDYNLLYLTLKSNGNNDEHRQQTRQYDTRDFSKLLHDVYL